MPLTLTVKHQQDGTSPGVYSYCFDKEEVLVGRDEATDVRLPHPSVSWVHLRLRREQQTWLAVDTGSTNGSLLDGQRLEPEQPISLQEGSQIQVGPFRLICSFIRTGRGEGAPPCTPPSETARFARQMVLQMLGALQQPRHLPHLRVLNGPEQERELSLAPGSGTLTVGRGEDCELRLPDADASRHHLELRRQGDEVIARDLGSKNGLLVNGQRCAGPCLLSDGDRLRVGLTELVFIDPTVRYLKELQARSDEEIRADGGAAHEHVTSQLPAVFVTGGAGWGASNWLLVAVASALVLTAVGAMAYLLL